MRLPTIFRPNKTKVVILVMLALASVLGFNYFAKKSSTPLRFVQVVRKDIKSTVSASGTLKAKSTVDLKFKSSGKLAFINVSPGDKVYAGQIIAGEDAQDLAITLQQAQNTLRDKQTAVDKVLDDIHLFQYGNGGFANVASANETMSQRQLRTSAEVARDNAFDALKQAQKSYQDAFLTSPVNGIVTQAVQGTGQVVTGSDLIAQISDLSDIYFDSEIDEADIGIIAINQKAEITLDAYPNKILSGVIEQIQPQTKTTSSGAVVILARIKLDPSDINFINGLSGQATIITAEKKNVLTIPQEALREDNSVVYQENNILKSKKVVTGIKSDIDVEVKEGLEEGEKILLNPPQSLGAQIQRQVNLLQRILRLFG